MSDYEFESSPEDPWITEEGEVRKEASPGEKVDIESLANPSLQGDVPSPSPVKSRTRTPKKTDEEKWEEYLEAYEELNKLKKKYADKITQHKRDFLRKNPSASKQEKKMALDKYKKKMKCFNCDQPGGIIIDGDTSITCGADDKCKLNIQLIKPNTIDLPQQIERLTNEINGQKQVITEYKLDLLFGLDDEEVILNEFQRNKDNLETLLSTIVELKKYYDKRNTSVEVPQLNPDTGEVISGPFGEKIWVSRKELLMKKQKELNQLISDFKKNISLYNKENVLVGRKKILNDTLYLYKNVMIPLQKEIRDLKYHKIYMDEIGTDSKGKGKEKPMSIFHFFPTQFDIENTVVQNNDFEVEMFEK